MLLMSAAEADASSNLQLKVDPPLEQLRPNRDEARLTLRPEKKKTAGKKVHWNIAVDLPQRRSFFSTDFPWIEGKRLLEIDFLTSREDVTWSTVFPIRGRYELTVKREMEREAPVESRFFLVIREDPRRLFNLGLFLVGLFFLGGLIGWAIPTPKAAIGLALLFMAGFAAEARLDIGPAQVGEITPIRFYLPDPEASRVNFSIVRTEDQKRLFHIEEVMVSGQASWGYHFFDGSLHKIRAAIWPYGSASSSAVEREVRVDALESPRNVVLATYAFFLLPLALGWPAGRWMKRRKLYKAR